MSKACKLENPEEKEVKDVQEQMKVGESSCAESNCSPTFALLLRLLQVVMAFVFCSIK